MSGNNEKITSFAGKDGEYKRQVSSFRDSVKEGGEFPPEKGKCGRCESESNIDGWVM